MGNLFDELEKRDLTELFDEQLRNQVDFAWPMEPEYLERNGLADAKSFLDIGSGNGYFLCRLAERHPKITFLGLEPSAELVQIANESIRRRGLSNVSFIAEKCPAQSVRESFDMVHARLCLYLAPNREEIIEWAHSLLGVGGHIVITDADDSCAYAYPSQQSWLKLIASANKIGKDADRHLGRKLPHLLLKAGFTDVKIEQHYWYSSMHMPLDKCKKLFGYTAYAFHRMGPDDFTMEDLKAFENMLEATDGAEKQTIMWPVVSASGVKR